ncbi:MAG: hypothetical protein GY884_05560 [Proteobacteria bacterium]|nr:hypothetical protein [Pseudomonadota bacterium]
MATRTPATPTAPDGDGYDEDCNDADADSHPFADEYCDGIDNDCDASYETSGGTVSDVTSTFNGTYASPAASEPLHRHLHVLRRHVLRAAREQQQDRRHHRRGRRHPVRRRRRLHPVRVQRGGHDVHGHHADRGQLRVRRRGPLQRRHRRDGRRDGRGQRQQQRRRGLPGRLRGGAACGCIL